MKIIVITEDYPPTSGGIAQWAFGIVQELIGLGHDVRVMTRADVFKLETFKFGSEKIVKMQFWQWHNFRSIYIAFYLIKEIFKKKPDLIIASTWNIGAFATDLKKIFRFKTILAYHGLEVTKQLNPKRKLKLLRAINNSNVNIAVSQFTKNEIIKKFNLDTNKISVLPNGVDVKRFYPKPKSEDLLEKHNLKNKKILLTLSRVIERKGHDIVIKSLVDVIKEVEDLIYLIAGVAETKFKEKLEALIKQLKLDPHVIFTGALGANEIIDYYNLCDFYIMISKGSGNKGDSEGFGITFLEANACEKAVIGSNVDGIPDAVEHMNNGLLIEANNVKETSNTILQLFQDSTLRDQLGKNGLKRIKTQFTWEAVTKRLLESIND
jgi:phosphatidyl-myo-inositol dimannoside synthase